jgi:hypothetical protein
MFEVLISAEFFRCIVEMTGLAYINIDTRRTTGAPVTGGKSTCRSGHLAPEFRPILPPLPLAPTRPTLCSCRRQWLTSSGYSVVLT